MHDRLRPARQDSRRDRERRRRRRARTRCARSSDPVPASSLHVNCATALSTSTEMRPGFAPTLLVAAADRLGFRPLLLLVLLGMTHHLATRAGLAGARYERSFAVGFPRRSGCARLPVPA
jgi:hypothetical protein